MKKKITLQKSKLKNFERKNQKKIYEKRNMLLEKFIAHLF